MDAIEYFSFYAMFWAFFYQKKDPLSIEPFESLYTEGVSFVIVSLLLTFEVEDLHDTK